MSGKAAHCFETMIKGSALAPSKVWGQVLTVWVLFEESIGYTILNFRPQTSSETDDNGEHSNGEEAASLVNLPMVVATQGEGGG